MKRLFLVVVYLFVFSIVSVAQSPELKIGGGGFTFGYGKASLNGFKPIIAPNVGQISNNQLMLGITGNRIYNKWMTGLSATYVSGDKIKTDSLNYKFSAQTLSFDLGYNLYQNTRVLIFPNIGVGINNFNVKQRKINTENINPRVSENNRAINIYNTSLHLDFSVNIRFIGKQKTVDGYTSSAMTGIKIGYLCGLKSSTWRYTGGSIIEGSPFSASMPYVQLIIGGFGSKPIHPNPVH